MANCRPLTPLLLPEGKENLILAFPPEKRLAAPGHDLKMEIGHVLCIDVVGYSKLLIHDQSDLLRQLNEIVRSAPQYRLAASAGQLLRLPTGDGMVLVFRDNSEAPVRCALEISAACQAHPTIPLRMGIHSGPVNEISDINERTNLAGAGLNIAQRIMDCGDAGHILLSKHVAEDLEHYPRWQPYLHPLGEFEAKHGTVISVVNLLTPSAGNAALPRPIARRKADTLRRFAGPRVKPPAPSIGPFLILGGSLLAAFWFITHPPTPSPSQPPAQVTAAIPEKSIAVLPFENLSADQETSFFADGIQDEILTNLAKISDLKVISRTSVMQYKTIRARNLREIGQELGVAHVLEGSVQREGSRIRVSAQLIDARTDAHLWAQVYERKVADVFALQSEVARTIAEQLQAKLSPREKAALAQSSTTDLVAEKLFRQAWQRIELASDPDARASLFEAIALLQEALARDPHFLRAAGLLVTAQMDLYWQGFDHTPARLALARAAIEQAARFHPDAGEVHLMRADYFYKAFRDYDRARAELDLARQTLPNDSLIFIYGAALDRRQGRWTESIRNWERGVALDPRNFRFLVETAFTYQALRRFEEAAGFYQRALAVKPEDQFARTELAQLPFSARADLQPWQAALSSILGKDPSAATAIANGLFNCALMERNPARMRRALEAIRPQGLRDPYNNSLWAHDWFVGLAARTLGRPEDARSAFLSARAIEEKAVQAQPEYAAAWSRLGAIDAALGRTAEAQAEGQRACELLPVAQDSWDGPTYVTNLAMIYAWTGDKPRALEQLTRSAQLPGGITYGELKLGPQWDPLRGDPRFGKILTALRPPQK